MDQRGMELFYTLFSGLNRQGPGDFASTKRAFELCVDLPPEPDVLDLGCGTGAQTLDLARISNGHITAIDNYQPFLDELAAKARNQGLADRITVLNGDMGKTPFPPESFDLIWSEGAAYSIGFDHALELWRPLLRPGGCLAVSELTWFKPDPPREVGDFFKAEYPPMRGEADNRQAFAETGYRVLGQFRLPDRSWWDDYYSGLERNLERYRRQWAGDSDATPILDMAETEMDMHKKFADWYGYSFLVGRKG